MCIKVGLHIVFTKGSIFKSTADVLVNPVNTVGVMGAGLALQFKTKYPKNFKHYKKYCSEIESFKEYHQCFFEEKDKIIYNLPTKENYSQFSSLGKVRRSLLKFVDYLNATDVESIAIPPIGAGLGGLDVMNVLHLILYYLRRVERPIKIELYGFKIRPTIQALIIQRYDFEYREQDKYCGVGSRETDEIGESKIMYLASILNCNGYTLSTGDASKGADLMFWTGIKSQKFRFGPFGRKPKSDTIVVPDSNPVHAVAATIAASVHPAWRFLPPWMRELHTRNVFQVMGKEISEPCEFVLCWTPDGAQREADTSKRTGGTGTAIKVADRFGVPVFNLKNDDALDKLGEFLGIDFVKGYAKRPR